MSVDIRKIRSFVLIAQLGSISAAARAARLAQPAVSQHLGALEREFGARLFERQRRGMVLTEAGKTVLLHANQILLHYDKARSEVQDADGEPRGPVGIGLPTTVAATVSAPLFRRIAAKYPKIRLRITESLSGYLREWVDAGRVDLAVLFEAVDAQNTGGEHLLIESMHLVSSGKDARFDGCKTVEARMLTNLPLILPGPPHALRLLVDRFAALNDLDLLVRAELDATAAMRQLVAEDHAYTILSYPPIRDDVLGGRLRASRIISPTFERRLVFCRSPLYQFSSAFRVVRDELISILNDSCNESGRARMVSDEEIHP